LKPKLEYKRSSVVVVFSLTVRWSNIQTSHQENIKFEHQLLGEADSRFKAERNKKKQTQMVCASGIANEDDDGRIRARN